MAQSGILAWKIPWTKEPGGLQSTGSQRIRHNGHSTHKPGRFLLLDIQNCGGERDCFTVSKCLCLDLYICLIIFPLYRGAKAIYIQQRVHLRFWVLIIFWPVTCSTTLFYDVGKQQGVLAPSLPVDHEVDNQQIHYSHVCFTFSTEFNKLHEIVNPAVFYKTVLVSDDSGQLQAKCSKHV